MFINYLDFLKWDILIFVPYLLILYSIIHFKKYFISKKSRDFLDMGDHQNKHTTPTMGGIAFYLLLPLIYFKLYLSSPAEGFFVILAAGLSGLIGFIDDWLKLKTGKGLRVKIKFILQMIAAFIPAIYYYFSFPELAYLNFFGYHLYLGVGIIFWVMLVIMSTTHAVNLTDGIDGLAIFQFWLIQFFIFIVILKGHYHQIFNILIFQFFLLNKNKAKIFMGDVGAFFLGGLLAGFFINSKIELLLPLSGIVFVLNTLSVIIQIIYYKIYQKRFFLFTPYHHALEKKGFSENKICIIFSIFTIIGNIIVLILYFQLFK